MDKNLKKKIVIICFGIVILAFGLYFGIKSYPQSHNPPPKRGSGVYPFGFTSISQEENEVAKEIGIDLVRKSISWDQIEPREGKFNFNEFKDNNKSQFDSFIRLKTGNVWATKCQINLCPKGNRDCPSRNADCPPKDLGNWSEKGYSPLLYDLVFQTLAYAKNKGLPDYKIIVGNEVNSPTFWLGTIEDYVKTRSTVYKAAQDINKKYNSNFTLVDNGFASAVWAYALIREKACGGEVDEAKDFAKRFFRRLYQTEEIDQSLQGENDCNKEYESLKQINNAFAVDPNLDKPTFDYMSYHFYEPWDTQEEVLNFIKDKMKKNGYDRPILNTEGGYADRLRLSYEKYPEVKTDVANDIPKIHAVAFANGVQSFFWLPLIEKYTGENFGPEWKGLELPNNDKLPAYFSYKTMTEKLNGFKTAQKVNGLKDKFVYKFTFEDKNPVYVIWDTSNNIFDFSSILNGNVKITHIDGSSNNSLSSNVAVGISPIYIEQ